MPRGFLNALAALLALALLATSVRPSSAAPPPAPGRDPDALNNSLQLLHLEYKQRVLQTYFTKSEFYFPPQWPRALADDYDKLASAAGTQTRARLKDIEDWQAASQKARANEVEMAYEIAENWIGKLRKGEVWYLDQQKTDLEWQEFLKKPKQSSVEVARFVEKLTKRMYDVSKGPEDNAWVAAMSLRYELQMRDAYRGALRDTDQLITAIGDFNRQRREIEARLEFLKHVETGFEAMGIVRDPAGKLLEKAEEMARDKTLEWLKANYKDIDDDAVKSTWDNVKGVITSGIELKGKLEELDNDADLKENAAALSAARRFTVLSSVYKQTLGQIRKLPGGKAFGPVLDLLDYYGEVLAIVPDVARKTQAMVRRVDQGHQGVRALDAFNVTGKEPAGLLQVETLREKFGVLIARDANIDPQSPQARYYLLVPEEVMPRKFATLDYAQYCRLQEAIAYERFLNAPKEAWRGPASWVAENMFEWRNTSILSSRVSDAYLADLKTKAGKTPFKEADLINLAQGRAAKIGDFDYTHERLANLADAELDSRARELILRISGVAPTPQGKAKWDAYVALLQEAGVALSPQQILNLFAHYASNDANANHVRAYLTGLEKERAARAQGRIAAGIPLVAAATPAARAVPGRKLEVRAAVLVTDLKPGREVDAQVRWQLPAWAPPPPPSTIKLANGIQRLPLSLDVPKNVDLKPFEAKVTLQVQGQPDITAVLQVQASVAAAQNPATPPAPPATRPLEFAGNGEFDVEAAPTGEIQISLLRVDRSTSNGIAVTSPALAAMKPDSKNGVSFALYRAESPSGPWTKVEEVAGMVWRKSPIIKPESQGFIADDSYLLLDNPQRQINGKQPPGPFYYRVEQSLINSEGAPVGKPAVSNVAGPEGATLRVLSKISPDGVLDPWALNGRWCRIEVALSYANQYYDAQGAIVKVTSGNWTGYFNTSRLENGTLFGFDAPSIVGSVAHLRVPWTPAGGTITIEATLGKLKASRTLKLPTDEKQAQQNRDRAQSILAQDPKALEQDKQNLASLKETVTRDAKALADAKPPEQFSYAHSRAQEMMALAKWRSEVKLYEQVRIPGRPRWSASAAAEAVGDFAAALEATASDVSFTEAAAAIALERLQEDDAATAYALGLPGDFNNLRASYTRDREQLPKRQEAARRAQWDAARAAWRRRGDLALLAGNEAAHRAAREAEATLQDQLGWTKDVVANMLREAAEEHAILSADRDLSKKWQDQADEFTLASRPPDQRAQLQADLAKRKPAWYPPPR